MLTAIYKYLFLRSQWGSQGGSLLIVGNLGEEVGDLGLIPLKLAGIGGRAGAESSAISLVYQAYLMIAKGQPYEEVPPLLILLSWQFIVELVNLGRQDEVVVREPAYGMCRKLDCQVFIICEM